ncbi:hypothetical protein [Lachnobacterium bovis]|uniref:DUF5082 domain-containing protein n=1 Tax=Lachnobacterium bovis DSM 14045 TaxID=1122142 RepID=A0A1H3MYC5_9FIRM|nr:hypothetical protein [Lachnobacterium bovis]SDY81576.1 hypothetical protein SAMN02910414_02436 [Lachnobacterium bovis DSM 14045]
MDPIYQEQMNSYSKDISKLKNLLTKFDGYERRAEELTKQYDELQKKLVGDNLEVKITGTFEGNLANSLAEKIKEIKNILDSATNSAKELQTGIRNEKVIIKKAINEKQNAYNAVENQMKGAMNSAG